MLYVDAPVGTGFSYSTTAENYHMDDYKSANEMYEFLRKVKQADFARLPIVEIIKTGYLLLCSGWSIILNINLTSSTLAAIHIPA